MELIPLYLGSTVLGCFLGRSFRNKKRQLGRIGTIQLLAIILLIFMLGARVGSNDDVISRLGTIGLTALIIALLALTGSIIATFTARKIMGIDKFGNRVAFSSDSKANSNEPLPSESVKTADTAPVKSDSSMKMTVVIIVSLICGILAGFFLTKEYSPLKQPVDSLLSVSGTVLIAGLCFLLFLVGIDIGLEGTVVKKFKQVGWRIFVFPIAIMIGTFAGVFAASLFFPLRLNEAMAVGAGFGWYSLAPTIIAGYSAELSAISLLCNVTREIISIICIPFVAKK